MLPVRGRVCYADHVIRLRTVLLAFLALASAASARDGVLTNVAELRALPQTEAALGRPARFEATVLIYDCRGQPESPHHELVVHDGTAGIFVLWEGGPLELGAGEKVAVSGRTERGQFAPVVKADSVTRIGAGSLPDPRTVTMKDILSGREDCQWVEIEGIVRRSGVAEERLTLVLDVEGSRVPIRFTAIPNAVPSLGDLVEARVAVRGTVTGRFNDQGQMTAVRFFFSPNPSFVRLLHTPSDDPFTRPPTPLLDVRERAADLPPTRRLKVQGVVTHWWPDQSVFIAGEGQSLELRGDLTGPFEEGDTVEAVGFRETGEDGAYLEDSVVRRTGTAIALAPIEITAAGAAAGLHEAELVTLRAHFVDHASADDGEVLLFNADGTPFTARWIGRMASLRPGDAVRITGICTGGRLPAAFIRNGWQPGPFQILTRSSSDLRQLSWWTRERLLGLAGATAVVLAGALLWIATLRRRVHAQTGLIREQARETAALEERNRIARELHDTLAQGFAGTAFALEGIATNLAPGDHVRPQIEMALRMVRHSLTEARRSVMNLRAEALEDRNLSDALSETAARLVADHAVELRTDIMPPSVSLPPGSDNEIFRIAVEAISNALRHAKPDSIDLSLRDRDDRLLLIVRDDGAGFDPSAPPANGHFGLAGMHERARRIGAELIIESAAGRGTEVILSLPKALPHA